MEAGGWVTGGMRRSNAASVSFCPSARISLSMRD
jgi:hypothetical protein